MYHFSLPLLWSETHPHESSLLRIFSHELFDSSVKGKVDTFLCISMTSMMREKSSTFHLHCRLSTIRRQRFSKLIYFLPKKNPSSSSQMQAQKRLFLDFLQSMRSLPVQKSGQDQRRSKCISKGEISREEKSSSSMITSGQEGRSSKPVVMHVRRGQKVFLLSLLMRYLQSE